MGAGGPGGRGVGNWGLYRYLKCHLLKCTMYVLAVFVDSICGSDESDSVVIVKYCDMCIVHDMYVSDVSSFLSLLRSLNSHLIVKHGVTKFLKRI